MRDEDVVVTVEAVRRRGSRLRTPRRESAVAGNGIFRVSGESYFAFSVRELREGETKLSHGDEDSLRPRRLVTR